MRRVVSLVGSLIAIVLTLLVVGDPAPAIAQDRAVPEITIIGPSQAWNREHYEGLQLLIAKMEEVGLKANYVATPNWPAFVKRAGSAPWGWGIAAANYVGRAQRLDPYEFLVTPFTETYIGDGGTNFGAYRNPRFQELAEKQHRTLDREARRRLVFEAQKILADDLAFMSVFHRRSVHVYNQQNWDNVTLSIGGNAFGTTRNFASATPKGAERVIKVGEVIQPKPLNPFNIPSSHEYLNLRLVYDTLADLNAAGVPEPWLAKSWTAVDDTTIDVTLREAKWHDGKPVTADDVAFSFAMYEKYPAAFVKAGVTPVASVTATARHAVRFKLKKPFAPLVHYTFTMVPIVPQHVWDGVIEREGLKRHPDEWLRPNLTGSGPFKVVKVVPDEGYVYTANRDHFLMPPKAEGLVYKGFANFEARFLALASGQLDFHTFYPLSPEQEKEARTNQRLKLVHDPEVGMSWIVFNMRDDSPFRDYAFRKAVSHLIDRRKITQDFAWGLADPGCSVIAPVNKEWLNPAVNCPEYNAGAAKQVLAEAGYKWDSKGRLLFPAAYKPVIYPTRKH
jgi:peptide/nickel transport system substrate-binding protein